MERDNRLKAELDKREAFRDKIEAEKDNTERENLKYLSDSECPKEDENEKDEDFQLHFFGIEFS